MSKFGTKCRSRKMGIIRGTEEGRNLSVFPLGVQTKSCNTKKRETVGQKRKDWGEVFVTRERSLCFQKEEGTNMANDD